LVVREKLPEPLQVTLWKCEVNKKLFGPTLKKGAKPVQDKLVAMSEDELIQLKAQLEAAGADG
jgi:glycyl-tRNA synthetase